MGLAPEPEGVARVVLSLYDGATASSSMNTWIAGKQCSRMCHIISFLTLGCWNQTEKAAWEKVMPFIFARLTKGNLQFFDEKELPCHI